MKNFLTTILFFGFSLVAYSSELLHHPLDFSGTQDEKEKVISYIQQNVKQTYSAIGMDDPSTLRMMEKEELNCPIPDDHIAPGRSALFLAWSVLRGIRNGGYDANQAA